MLKHGIRVPLLGKLVIACAFALAGCGGGGGGGNSGGGSRNGTITVSPGSLTFIANGPSAPTPAPQSLVGTVSGVSGGTLYITVVGSGPAISTISSVSLISDTAGQATVSVPSPATLGVGTHTGTITVRACVNDASCSSANLQGSPKTIPVTYHVAAIQPSASSLDFSVGNTPAASDSSRQLTVTTVPAENWTAVNSVAWLSVTQGGGSGTSMDVSLVQAAVDGMSNGTYIGSIRLQHSTVGGLQLDVPVTLRINRTQVNHVSPYVAYTGTPSDVIIRGDEFSQITIQGVSFGSTPAQSFTVDSATQIRARVPALPAGRYPVNLQGNFPDVRRFAELVVVAPPAFTAATLPYATPGIPHALRYDAERAAVAVSLWTATTGGTAMVRYARDGNAWQSPVSRTLTNHFGLALAADGTEWIAGADKQVVHLDANDLAIVRTVDSPLFPGGTQHIADMAVANDGTVAMFGDVNYNCGAHLLLYDVRKQSFALPEPVHVVCRGNIGASADGARLLLANQFIEFSGDDISVLDTGSRTVTPTGIHQLTAAPPQMNQDASRIVLNKTRVYASSYALLGTLPATNDVVVLSPDGSRAYAFEKVGLRLHTYDLTASPATPNDLFPEIGAPTVVPDPGISSGSSLFNDSTVLMTITPDGDTLFIAGSERIVVQPVP